MVIRVLFLTVFLVAAIPLGSAWGNAEMPPEFKGQVPLYDRAQANEARYTRESVRVAFSTADAYAQVHAFYLSTLKADGWHIHPAKATAADQPSLEAVKGKRILILQPVKAEASSSSGFTIELHYPGGRE